MTCWKVSVAKCDSMKFLGVTGTEGFPLWLAFPPDTQPGSGKIARKFPTVVLARGEKQQTQLIPFPTEQKAESAGEWGRVSKIVAHGSGGVPLQREKGMKVYKIKAFISREKHFKTKAKGPLCLPTTAGEKEQGQRKRWGRGGSPSKEEGRECSWGRSPETLVHSTFQTSKLNRNNGTQHQKHDV